MKRNISSEDIREKLLPVVKRLGIEKVVLFGSRARGDYNDKSDYDFYVEAPRVRSVFDLCELCEEFRRCLSAKVDVVLPPDEYTRVNKALFESIDRDGIAIYG